MTAGQHELKALIRECANSDKRLSHDEIAELVVARLEEMGTAAMKAALLEAVRRLVTADIYRPSRRARSRLERTFRPGDGQATLSASQELTLEEFREALATEESSPTPDPRKLKQLRAFLEKAEKRLV